MRKIPYVIGVRVQAYIRDESGTKWNRAGRSTTTDANGNYEIVGLSRGRYTVGFGTYETAYPYIVEFWNNASDLDSAEGFDLSGVGQIRRNINPSLSLKEVDLDPAKIIDFAHMGTDAFQLLYTGTEGADYTLQITSDFQTWTDVGSWNCSPGINIIPITSTEPKNFWRLILP